MLKDPAGHTAEGSSRQELWEASARLGIWLVVLAGVGPLVGMLPVGQTTRTTVLGLVLLALAFHWLWRGLGYRPLLLTQLALFSMAITVLALKALLVILGVESGDLLRDLGRWLMIAGGLCAGANLGMMLVASLRARSD